jgi:hypothetical protein
MSEQTVFEDRTIRYELAGKSLEMKPLTFKELKKALGVVESVSAQLMQVGPADPVQFVQAIPPLLAGKFKELAPVLFPNQGLTDEWIEENVAVHQARKIVMDAARINDVMDFLGQFRSHLPQATPEKSPGV